VEGDEPGYRSGGENEPGIVDLDKSCIAIRYGWTFRRGMANL